MRIAFVCTEKNSVPAIRGGAIQILIDGIKGKCSQGNELTVYSVMDPDLPSEEIRDGIRYFRFPQASYFVDVVTALEQHSGEFDVIHVFNRPVHVSKFKKASPHSRIVLSLHNEMFQFKKISQTRGIECINDTDRILTVSNYIASTVTHRFGLAAPKIRTWYSGADTKGFFPTWSSEGRLIREEMRDRYGLGDKKVLIYVGRLSEKKGVHVLLEAFRLLANEINDLVLVVVGSKWFGHNREDDYVRSLRRRSEAVSDKVIFTGHIAPQEISRYYLLGDVFICSSQWQEPLARVHYEAMAAGLPIITTARGGNPEVIKDGINGIVIYDYQNSEAFVSAVKMLLAQPEYASALAKTARLTVEDSFSFQRVAKDLLQHYREVCTPVAIKTSVTASYVINMRR